MNIISHRGNLTGSDPYRENHPDYIDKAIAALNPHNYRSGVVEVDVWGDTGNDYRIIQDGLFLGHDFPSHKVNEDWLRKRSKSLILHCKNIEAVDCLLRARNLRGLDVEWFWHENDKMTITNRGRLWMYPGNHHPAATTVLLGKPDRDTMPKTPMAGICTDHPLDWEKFRLDAINELQEFIAQTKDKTTEELIAMRRNGGA